MKPFLIFFLFLSFHTAPLHSQTADQLGANTFGPNRWKTDADYWDRILRERPPLLEYRLGGSDYSFSGPLAEAFKRERLPEDSSRTRKFLGLPIVRLFVPQKMDRPPGGTGRYFAWRLTPDAWGNRASLAATPPGHWANGAYR